MSSVPNANVSKFQCSGVQIGGGTGSQTSGGNSIGGIVSGGITSASGTIYGSGGFFAATVTQCPFSGIYTANVPTSESSWNV